jgi:general secretion pathway protein I
LKTGRNGFTLLEIVVALAILGIGLILIIELFSGGLRLGRTSEEYTRAVGYTRMKMEELQVAKSLEEGMQEGVFDRDFRWQVEVKKVDLLPPEREIQYKPPVELFHLRIDVLWNSGKQERATGIETYRVLKAVKSESER